MTGCGYLCPNGFFGGGYFGGGSRSAIPR